MSFPRDINDGNDDINSRLEMASPSKRKRVASTEVSKYGVDYLFKRQAEKQQVLSPSTDIAVVQRQIDADEAFARSLQQATSKNLASSPTDAVIELDEEQPKESVPSVDIVQEVTMTQPSEIDGEPGIPIPLDKGPLDFSVKEDAAIAGLWSKQGGAPYSFLSQTFVLVNSTRSRLKIVDYLVNSLRVLIHYDPGSLLHAVWLMTNAIAPPFEPIELNLGPSIISKAIKTASGVSSARLKMLWDKYGDVGDVAFEAKMTVRTLVQPRQLRISGVYKVLRKIAASKGQGTQVSKQKLVESLLVAAKGEEVRYIGRTLVQHLRIGAVKTTLLIALSRAFLLTHPPNSPWTVQSDWSSISKEERSVRFKSSEETVKQCFARQPSYDDLIPALLEVGLGDLTKQCGIKVGVPIRPMLGTITNDISDMQTIMQEKRFTCEFKYDGQRAQIHCDNKGRVSIFSRHLETMTEKYPDLVALAQGFRRDYVNDFIMEGEVVAIDVKSGIIQNFQTLTNRARKNVGHWRRQRASMHVRL